MSTNDPEVIESLRASWSGNGIVMAKVATSTMRELFEALDEFKWYTRFGRGWLSLASMQHLNSRGARDIEMSANPLNNGERMYFMEGSDQGTLVSKL